MPRRLILDGHDDNDIISLRVGRVGSVSVSTSSGGMDCSLLSPVRLPSQRSRSRRPCDQQQNIMQKLSPSAIGGKMSTVLILLVLYCTVASAEGRNRNNNSNNSTNGFFVQIPYSNPPTVRPPPYTISDENCPAMNVRENWIDTLCGDLNTGVVPKNPLGHKFTDGGAYPFDIIKNKTLDFFRRALPILKSDKSLPKVARFAYNEQQHQTSKEHHRGRRGLATRSTPIELEAEKINPVLESYMENAPRTSRRRRQGPGNRFCDNALLCKLYNAMWGKAPHTYQRDSMENRYYHPNQNNKNYHPRPGNLDLTIAAESAKAGKNIDRIPNQGDMPPTPCSSSAEYLTPVFARNHEGAWRYVVQIPREGYFTQTVEVTKCLQSECFYMDGSCRTSPRWQSLLVAEMYYPKASFPTTPKPKSTAEPPSITDFNRYQEYLYSRASSENKNENGKSGNEIGSSGDQSDSSFVPAQCDGLDDIGCYQVRLFYDWFLIPGSCKCWKRQFDFTSNYNHKSRSH